MLTSLPIPSLERPGLQVRSASYCVHLVVSRVALRDLAVAISLANLCFLRLSEELLLNGRLGSFFLKMPPEPVHYVSALLGFIVLAVVAYSAIVLVRFSSAGWRLLGGLIFTTLMVAALNAIRMVLIPYVSFMSLPRLLHAVRGGAGIGAGLAVAILLAGLVRHLSLAARAIRLALLVLFPAFALIAARELWVMATRDATAFRDKPAASPLPASGVSSAHVIWVVFDEWDQALSFERRATDLQMPEVDRFRQAAFYATEAHSPALETRLSMPSLILGEQVVAESVLAPDRLEVTLASGQRRVLGMDRDSIFSDVRRLGLNAAAAGWYFPYCRIFGSDLTGCWWDQLPTSSSGPGGRFADTFIGQLRIPFETNGRSLLGEPQATRQHRRLYEELMQRGSQWATDRRFHFVLWHVPVPHTPYVYDRRSGRFQHPRGDAGDYNDGLALVDRTLGDLRRNLQNAGLWDSSTVVLSSDHCYRAAALYGYRFDSRIPFLIKLSRQTVGRTYHGAFNAILTRRLLLAVLKGEIRNPADLAMWLDRERTTVPVTSVNQSCPTNLDSIGE